MQGIVLVLVEDAGADRVLLVEHRARQAPLVHAQRGAQQLHGVNRPACARALLEPSSASRRTLRPVWGLWRMARVGDRDLAGVLGVIPVGRAGDNPQNPCKV